MRAAGDRPDDDLAAAVRRWSLGAPRLVADTATSRVYRAERSGEPVALKLLKPYGADEIRGTSLMAWYDGAGAATIHDRHENAILMEWLDGRLLGDLVRSGDDDRATWVLCHVLSQLHRSRGHAPDGLRPLRRQFAALLDDNPSFWPDSHREPAARAAGIAHALFDDPVMPIPLHGDFHHDNVLESGRGWLAIDPKGLVGDPAYDVANLFRNPVGAGDIAATPARIDALATAFSQERGLDRRRILSWAAAHVALSACWDHAAGNPIEFNLIMLPRLLAAIDRS